MQAGASALQTSTAILGCHAKLQMWPLRFALSAPAATIVILQPGPIDHTKEQEKADEEHDLAASRDATQLHPRQCIHRSKMLSPRIRDTGPDNLRIAAYVTRCSGQARQLSLSVSPPQRRRSPDDGALGFLRDSLNYMR